LQLQQQLLFAMPVNAGFIAVANPYIRVFSCFISAVNNLISMGTWNNHYYNPSLA
jgi:hypothetical protein